MKDSFLDKDFVLKSLSCVWLFATMDCSPPGSSVHGILQARILEWVAIPFSRGSSQPRDQTQVSCIAGRGFNLWATGEAQTKTREGASAPFSWRRSWCFCQKSRSLLEYSYLWAGSLWLKPWIFFSSPRLSSELIWVFVQSIQIFRSFLVLLTHAAEGIRGARAASLGKAGLSFYCFSWDALVPGLSLL